MDFAIDPNSTYTKSKEIDNDIDMLINGLSYDIMLRTKEQSVEGSSQLISSHEWNNEESSLRLLPKVVRDEKLQNYYSKTQKWIGHITSINKTNFIAKLEDLTNQGTNEIGEFDIEEISKDDKPLLSIGAVFYWSLGYSHENGQKSKKSLLRFQRVTEFTQDEIDGALDRAKDLINKIKWEE